MTNPFLAAIDALRASIQRDTELLRLLERRAGVETHPPVPALPVVREAKPAALPKPAGEPAKRGKVDPDRVRELHAKGMDDGQIGGELGVSASAITLWRKKLGLAAIGRGGRKAATEPVGSAHVVAAFLRERGVELTGPDNGRWKINGRDTVDRDGLLKLANTKRAAIGKPAFAWATL